MSRNVVALRPELVEAPASRPSMLDDLDALEAAAAEAGVLFADVEGQLALARHVVEITAPITLGPEPTIAQVHAVRLLTNVWTDTYRLVVEHSQRRQRR